MLAGLTLAALTGGKQRLRELWRQLTDCRRIGFRWLALIVLFWPAFDLCISGAALALGVTDRPVNLVWSVLTDLRTLSFILFLSFVVAAVEEIGLRGYWLDVLQERLAPVTAGLVNGAVWAVWHSPFTGFPDYYASTTFNPELWWWLPSIVLDALLIAWVYNKTGRSVLAALLFHGMMNFSGEFLGLAPEMFPFMLIGRLLVVSVLVLAWRRTGSELARPRPGK